MDNYNEYKIIKGNKFTEVKLLAENSQKIKKSPEKTCKIKSIIVKCL